jgi:hypothetical protein
MFAKAFPTNRGVLFNHKDPPIYARKLRESWRAWPHEARSRTLFMMYIQVGIARNFEKIILDVAHVWNYTIEGATQKAHDVCQLSTKGAKNNKVLEPGLEPATLR